jgi:hypothetical protein
MPHQVGAVAASPQANFGMPLLDVSYWGGGYNTNSLSGGGWGGYPSGYGLYGEASTPGFIIPRECPGNFGRIPPINANFATGCRF